MMLNGGEYGGTRIVADSTVALFTRRVAGAGSRALGWDTCSGEGSCGKYLSERAYGHTGYTGTSLWIDPDHDVFVVLLTNRVHEARAKRPAKVIADVRADLSDAAELAITDDPDGLLTMPKSFRADRAVNWNPPKHRVRTRKVHHTKKSTARSTRSSTGKKSASSSAHRKSGTAASSGKHAKASKTSKPVTSAKHSTTKSSVHSHKTPAKKSSGKKK
jgi:hypothetical protein